MNKSLQELISELMNEKTYYELLESGWQYERGKGWIAPPEHCGLCEIEDDEEQAA